MYPAQRPLCQVPIIVEWTQRCPENPKIKNTGLHRVSNPGPPSAEASRFTPQLPLLITCIRCYLIRRFKSLFLNLLDSG